MSTRHIPQKPPAQSGSWRSLVYGNVGWLSLVSLLNDAASEMIYPLLPLFVTRYLGAGPAFLGLLEGAADSASSLLKLAGGRISDRAHRRKPLVGWGYAIAAFVRPLIALATAGWHVLAVRLADRVGKGIRTAPRDALLAESVTPERRGVAFGIHRGADHAGAVLGPLIATLFLLAFPNALRPLFAVSLLPGLIAVAVVTLRVRERAFQSSAAGTAAEAPAQPPPEPELEAGDDAADATSPRSHAQGFHRYLLVLLLFTLGNASDAFLLLRAQQLGVAIALLPLLWGAFHVSKMAWSVPGGAMADRIGPRPAILAGWSVYAAVYAGFAFAAVPWHVWALFLAYGLFYGLTESPEKALVARFASSTRRGSAFGAYHFAVGLAALPASLVFGEIYQHVSAQAAFLYGAAVALLAALLFLVIVPRSPHPAA